MTTTHDLHQETGPVALYASAGTDTRGISFLSREFLDARRASIVPAPSCFVLIDRETPVDPDASEARLEFNDERTRITTVAVESRRLFGFDAVLLDVSHDSNFGVRHVRVVRVRADNEAFAGAARHLEWVPDVFIGVTDGCQFGTNAHCVNRLTAGHLPAATLRKLRVPRWWVTDHFSNAEVPSTLAEGDFVRSREKDFPYEFRKVALLSTRWGKYGRDCAIGGATVFEAIAR